MAPLKTKRSRASRSECSKQTEFNFRPASTDWDIRPLTICVLRSFMVLYLVGLASFTVRSAVRTGTLHTWLWLSRAQHPVLGTQRVFRARLCEWVNSGEHVHQAAGWTVWTHVRTGNADWGVTSGGLRGRQALRAVLTLRNWKVRYCGDLWLSWFSGPSDAGGPFLCPALYLMPAIIWQSCQWFLKLILWQIRIRFVIGNKGDKDRKILFPFKKNWLRGWNLGCDFRLLL